MSRDPIIEEIRRAQSAVRRSRQPEALPDAYGPGEGSDVKAMIGELFQRIDRTQEHLLRTIAERTAAGAVEAPSAAGASTAPGSPSENAILAEILAKLDLSGSGDAVEDRLSGLETSLEKVLSALESRSGTPSPALLEPLIDRLDAIERRLRVVAEFDPSALDFGAVREELQGLSEKVGTLGSAVPGDGGEPVSLEPISERLEAIQERLGGDAGAMTLGAALARLSESVERVEGGLGSLGSGGEGSESGGGIDPAWTQKIEETLTSIAERGDDDSAVKAISTLKRDFSLLVHTINGHLQESRHRSEKVENALEVIVSALAPIARVAGVELETTPELESSPEPEKDLA